MCYGFELLAMFLALNSGLFSYFHISMAPDETSKAAEGLRRRTNSNDKTRNSAQKVRGVRAPLFEYPPLPEIRLCFLVTVGTIAYGWYSVFVASQRWISKIDAIPNPTNFPLIGPRFKDESNWEWFRWSPFALQYLPLLVLHSLVFNVFEKFMPDSVWVPLNILISMAISAHLFTAKLLICSIVQGLFIFGCTLCHRSSRPFHSFFQ